MFPIVTDHPLARSALPDAPVVPEAPDARGPARRRFVRALRRDV